MTMTVQERLDAFADEMAKILEENHDSIVMELADPGTSREIIKAYGYLEGFARSRASRPFAPICFGSAN
jgi:hypothetical protein